MNHQKKPLLFVANWKMNMPLHKACSFIQDNRKALIQLTNDPNKIVVLCPSFPFYMFLSREAADIPMPLGGQNCSEYESGPYTGQVSAQMLADVNCNYCIIGHSECRIAFNENDEQIATKALQLIKVGIIPIVCIGENKKEQAAGITQNVLIKQLAPLINALKDYTGTLCIAYEPLWAIGTNLIPNISELQKICDFLADHLKTGLPLAKLIVIYGGSVDENNAAEILTIGTIGGLLVGGASLNFQKFQKIVSLNKTA